MKLLLVLLFNLLLVVPALGTPDRGMVDHVTNSNTLQCDSGRVGWRIYDLAEAREEYCDGSAWVPASTWTGGLTSVFDCTGPECNDIEVKTNSVLNFSNDGTFKAVENGVELWLPIDDSSGANCWTWLDPLAPPYTPKEGAICLPMSTSSVGSEYVLVGRDLSAIPNVPAYDQAAAQDISGDIRGVFDCYDYNHQSGKELGEMDQYYYFASDSTVGCRNINVPDGAHLNFGTDNTDCDLGNQDDGDISSVSGPAPGPAEINCSAAHNIPTATEKVLIRGTGGVPPAGYDGYWTATVVDSDTFSIVTPNTGTATGEFAWFSSTNSDCLPPSVNDAVTGMTLPGLYGTDWLHYQWGHHCRNFVNPVLSGTNGAINGAAIEGEGQVCYYHGDPTDTNTTVDTQGDENWDRQLWVGNGENSTITSIANNGGLVEFTTNVAFPFRHRFLPGERVDITGTTNDYYDGATLTVTSVTGASDNVVQTGQAYTNPASGGTMSLNPDRIGGVCQQILWSDHAGTVGGTMYLNMRSHNGGAVLDNEDEFLMAAAVMTGSHLACTVDAAPGAGLSWDITLLSGIEDTLDTSGTASTNVTCSIEGATALHCVDNDNIAAIPASTIVNPWAIALEVVGDVGAAAATVDCRLCLTAR